MHKEFSEFNRTSSSRNSTNSNKGGSSESAVQQEQQQKSTERLEQQQDLERTMQGLVVSNNQNENTNINNVVQQQQPVDCPSTPVNGLGHPAAEMMMFSEYQQQQENGGCFLPSSSPSSSSSSSFDAGMNGGPPQQQLGGEQKKQQPSTPKRSKLKKCLHLDLLSISNSNCHNGTAISSPSAAERHGGGVLSPWNQPQFQPRRAQRPSKLFPVHILPYLYLGNDDTAKNRETLDKCGIRYVINVTSDLPNYFDGTSATDKTATEEAADNDQQQRRIVYMRIPVDDNCSHNLAQFFPDAISFIEKARSERAAVLVHCWAGISRSVTVCLAYLMYSLHCTMDEAFDRLLKQNGTISPNFHFMEALTRWERELLSNLSSALPPVPATAPPSLSAAAKNNNFSSSKSPTVAMGLSTPRSPSSFSQLGQLEAQTAAN